MSTSIDYMAKFRKMLNGKWEETKIVENLIFYKNLRETFCPPESPKGITISRTC